MPDSSACFDWLRPCSAQRICLQTQRSVSNAVLAVSLLSQDRNFAAACPRVELPALPFPSPSVAALPTACHKQTQQAKPPNSLQTSWQSPRPNLQCSLDPTSRKVEPHCQRRKSQWPFGPQEGTGGGGATFEVPTPTALHCRS